MLLGRNKRKKNTEGLAARELEIATHSTALRAGFLAMTTSMQNQVSKKDLLICVKKLHKFTIIYINWQFRHDFSPICTNNSPATWCEPSHPTWHVELSRDIWLRTIGTFHSKPDASTPLRFAQHDNKDRPFRVPGNTGEDQGSELD